MVNPLRKLFGEKPQYDFAGNILRQDDFNKIIENLSLLENLNMTHTLNETGGIYEFDTGIKAEYTNNAESGMMEQVVLTITQKTLNTPLFRFDTGIYKNEDLGAFNANRSGSAVFYNEMGQTLTGVIFPDRVEIAGLEDGYILSNDLLFENTKTVTITRNEDGVITSITTL